MVRFAPLLPLAALALVACRGTEPVAGPQGAPYLSVGSPLGGTLLISAGFDDFPGEIYTMRPDGSALTRLTHAPGAMDDGARWSPDWRRIAFHSDRAGSLDLYLMNADGSGVVQLTGGPEQDGYPVWSPDGRRLAFGRDDPAPGFRPDVYVINADGTGLMQLTTGPGAERLPVWSPTGGQLLFHRGGGSPDIWIMNADGTGQAPLLATPLFEVATDWSPDGRILIAQRSGAAPFDLQVFVMEADGTGLTRLTNLPNGAFNARWSWDQRRILFAHTDPADAPGITDIWVMDADGSDPMPLTDTRGEWEWNLDWRPW